MYPSQWMEEGRKYEAALRLNSATFTRDFLNPNPNPNVQKNNLKVHTGSDKVGFYMNAAPQIEMSLYGSSDATSKTVKTQTGVYQALPDDSAIQVRYYTNVAYCDFEYDFYPKLEPSASAHYRVKQWYLPQLSKSSLTVLVRERTDAVTAELSTPQGDFYPGQQVPVVVNFGFPLKITGDMKLTINDQEMTPVEVEATSEYCTFLYQVKELDSSRLQGYQHDGSASRNVQATNDGYLDENPQLTAVKFSADNERFVLGWYTQQSASSDQAMDGGEAAADDNTSDIRLLEFDRTGATAQLLPDSLDQIASGQNASITSNFRFTKNAETVNDLSILWVERAKEAASENTSGLPAEKDLLKGVKLYTYGQNNELVGFTSVVNIADMADSTLIDHFDAYVSSPENNQVKAVILGTTYGSQGTVSRTAQAAGGETVQVNLPSQTSAMYTATAAYGDQIAVPGFIPDYDTVKLGAKTQIEFTVENQGIHAVSDINMDIGGTQTAFSGLNLLPGSSIQLMADYQVPDNKVVDPQYTVTATFNENAGATGAAQTHSGSRVNPLANPAGSNTATGILYLNLPDVAITEAKIVREEAGERTIQVKLNNHSDAALMDSGRSVKLSFYSDASRETPVQGLAPISITENHDLAMLDEGGYSVQTTLRTCQRPPRSQRKLPRPPHPLSQA